MKYCGKCGNSMQDDMTFCPKCGTPTAGVDQSKAKFVKKMNPALIISLVVIGLVVLVVIVIVINLSSSSEDTFTYDSLSDSQIVRTLDFTLHNNTGADIYYIYLSRSYDDTWGSDLLGDDILFAGRKLLITGFSGELSYMYEGRENYYWDLMIEDGEGYYLIWDSLDILNITNLYISIDASGYAVAEWD